MIGRILDIATAKLVQVRGASMDPAFPDGSWVVVNRRAYRWPNKPQRFDVVRFEDPVTPGRWFLKRVVGLPDEEVSLEDGQLKINGSEIPEPHVPDSESPTSDHSWWPCTNEYVLLGDNRAASTDSRKFGTVSLGAITGKVTRRLR